MSGAVELARIRTEEYDRMANAGVFGPERRRIELVGGHLYEMPPIGTAHLIVVSRLQQQLNALNADGRLLVQQPIRVPDFDEPQPDLAVLQLPLGRAKPGALDCELVIEVSDTTLKFDREEKMHAYRMGGVPRVWIVNLPHGVIEEYGSPSWRAEVHYPGEGEPQVAGIQIDLQSLFHDIEVGG